MLKQIPQSTIMIDLHGKSIQETKKLLIEHFALIEEKQIQEFYIITGKGNHRNTQGTWGVLKKVLPKLLKPYSEKILEIDPEAGSYKIVLKPTQQRNPLKEMLASFDQNMLKTLTKEAEQNDIHALVALALIHLTEAIDPQKGMNLLEQAKQLGSLEAYALLGDLYLKNQNYPAAIKHLKYAAEHNDSLGQLGLARCYLLGQGVKQNDKQSSYWMTKAAQQGEAYAQSNLGRSYYNGEFTEQNIELAIKYLNLAAKQGVAGSMSYLARCYAAGDGVAQDIKKAFSLYRRAAELKDIYALHLVGQFYLDGRSGFPPSKEKALPWFIEAAKLGDADSQARLAFIYLLGKEKELEKGYAWLQKALNSKNRLAYYVLGHAYQEGIGKYPQDNSKAYEFIKLAAEANYSTAQYELAAMLLLGENQAVPQDHDRGLYWLKKAAERRCVPAIQALQAGNLERIQASLRQQSIAIIKEKLSNAANQAGRVKNVDSLLRAAKEGDILAQAIILGKKTLSKADYELISKEFWAQEEEKILSIPNEDAIFIIIDAYMLMENLTQSQIGKILYLLTEIAAKPNPKALYRLGLGYNDDGLFGKKDKEKAEQYLQEGAKLNDKDCLCVLGYFYKEKAHIDAAAYQKAFVYHAKAAELGSANSYNELGILYKDGKGIEKNIPKAIECFQQAMVLDNNNNSPTLQNGLLEGSSAYQHAAYNLAMLYLTGNDRLPKNEVKGIFLMKKAADAGLENANKFLERIGLSPKTYQENENASFWKQPPVSVKTVEPKIVLNNFSKSLGLKIKWNIAKSNTAWGYLNSEDSNVLNHYSIEPFTIRKTTEQRYILLLDNILNYDLIQITERIKKQTNISDVTFTNFG